MAAAPHLLTPRGETVQSNCMEPLWGFPIYFLLIMSTANLLCSPAKGCFMQLPGLCSELGPSRGEGFWVCCLIPRQGAQEPLFCAAAVALLNESGRGMVVWEDQPDRTPSPCWPHWLEGPSRPEGDGPKPNLQLHCLCRGLRISLSTILPPPLKIF